MGGWRDGCAEGGMSGRRDGFKEWVDGWAEKWVDGGMGLRVGFININDMYKMTVGKGRV